MVQLESQSTFLSSSARIFRSASEMRFFDMLSPVPGSIIALNLPQAAMFARVPSPFSRRRFHDRLGTNAGAAMATEYILLGAIGFLAQLIDGALGMAFGVISTTAMLSMGMPPAQASALVHTAEIFTTAASAGSHIWHRNVDWRLVIRLGIAGVLGAVLGAWILSNVDASTVRPYISAYLLLVGGFILFKAWRGIPARDAPAPWVGPIGFVA